MNRFHFPLIVLILLALASLWSGWRIILAARRNGTREALGLIVVLFGLLCLFLLFACWRGWLLPPFT